MSKRAGRVVPTEPDAWSEETRELFGGTIDRVASLEGREGQTPPAPERNQAPPPRPLNILRTIAHHPSLLRPFLGFAATLATAGVLVRRESELLALRTAWRCRSDFEWGHHVLYARAAGLSDEEIDRIPDGPEAPGWSPTDALLLRAADELHDHHDWSDALFEALREKWSDAELVEITFVVGNYTMLSMVANATGVPLEEDLPELPTPKR